MSVPTSDIGEMTRPGCPLSMLPPPIVHYVVRSRISPELYWNPSARRIEGHSMGNEE
jgi:hypothetical protein